jgi:tripartite ATP-independent transporter DctP family solute receptor
MLKKWVTLLGIFLILALMYIGPVSGETITIRIGFSDPASMPWGRGLNVLKRIVETESKGRITVQLFPSEQLGSLVEQIESVRKGAQEIALASPGFYPRMDMLEMPFLVSDWRQVQSMLNSQAFRDLATLAGKETGLIIYGKFPYGFRNICNTKRPIKTMEDLKGMKLRTQNSPAHLAIFRALGASPIAIAWGETYQAVQTGIVDGLENANTVLMTNKFPMIAKYISTTRHLFGMLLAYINPKFYGSLSEKDRLLLDQGMREAEATNLKLVLEEEEKTVKALLDMGALINDVPADTLQKMREAAQPVYKSLGARFEPELSALQKAARE